MEAVNSQMSGDPLETARRTAIYQIVDPRDGEIRYIGKAVENRLSERWSNHLRDARANKKTRCHRWIRGLLKLGLKPDFSVVEWVTDDWEEAERRWIRVLREHGSQLLNHSDGGQGPLGRKMSAETIEKLRAVHIGAKRSDEARARMRAAWTPERMERHRILHLGKEIPQNVRDAVSKANKGKKFDPEVVEKRASKIRGRKQTAEQRAKSGEGVRRSWTPERRQQQADRMREGRRSGRIATAGKEKC